MTFDEGLSRDTREKPSLAARIMTSAGDIKELPISLDQDRAAAGRCHIRFAQAGRMSENLGDRPRLWA